MKKLICLVLALVMVLCACAAPGAERKEETVRFTDSTGRTVEVPAKIESIAISGPLSQVYIIPLAGDR